MPKILLVEDNDINRDMLSRRLERKGYDVIIAVNGEESVAKTLSDRPDIVLMDLHLPVLDGWEATRQIKANPQTRDIPVIALTADAIAGEREKALAAGCDEYETKPIDLPRLLQKIDNLLVAPASPSPPTPNSSPDRHSQQILITHLRHQLDPPIDRILGYSDLLLATLSDSAMRTLLGETHAEVSSARFHPLRERQQSALAIDIQKIHLAGMQLLQLVRAILNPVLMEIQHQDITVLTPTLRREILTPLSTIIGYCELLLEEANLDIIPELEQIQTAARDLLDIANNLDRSLAEPLPWRIDLSTITQIPAKPTLHYPTIVTPPPLGESQILVIDDNAANSSLLWKHLARLGSQVSIATTEQATHALATMPFDLVMLDLSLDGSGGLQVLEQIESHPQWRQIPVLILANPDELDLVVRGIAMGAADYLTKPLQSVLLHAKVATCLERKRWQERECSFDLLFENAPLGVYQATVAGSYRRVNPALVRLLGYPNAETLMAVVTNIGDRIYVDPDRYAQFQCRLAEHDLVTGFEYQAYRHDGETLWVAEHARAVRDPDGQLAYYEGIVEDISHHKQAEAAFKPQIAALQLEIENLKRTQQVGEIVQTDYFQQLQPDSDRWQSLGKAESSLPRKVLLVEDNELNRDMLLRRLERAGYQVAIANDGAEGVAKARSELPDLILMDISLPVMDGWEATQQLKANPQTAGIPIIALTAHAMAGDREKALAAGCNDYDTKPIELPRLIGKIEKCLNGSISNS
jgi:PAS domain S-box-containing protein